MTDGDIPKQMSHDTAKATGVSPWPKKSNEKRRIGGNRGDLPPATCMQLLEDEEGL